VACSEPGLGENNSAFLEKEEVGSQKKINEAKVAPHSQLFKTSMHVIMI